ncbi:hypothetical protein L9F63_022428, partial [Diploptera punctata]
PELSLPPFISELYTVLKDSFSAVSVVEVFTVTLARGPHKVLLLPLTLFQPDLGQAMADGILNISYLGPSPG